jgi:hypothetical protein
MSFLDLIHKNHAIGGAKTGNRLLHLALSLVLALSGVVAAPLSSQAVTLQPMSIAYDGIVSGNFSSTGNSVLTCSTTSGT